MQQHIIEAAISGDATALEHIYNATIDRAYAIAFSIVKDEFEAQDITQEAYLTVFQRINTIEDSTRIEAWIAAIVRNKAIDYTRKNHPELFTDIESSVDDEDFSYADTIEAKGREYYPDEQIEQKETKRLIWEIIGELPEKQKQCIILRYQDDLKIKDIAVEMGLSEATVKSCLKYAHRKIEAGVKKLEKEGTKLYSFTPLTLMLFLRWMFREDKENRAAAAALSATKAGSRKVVGAKAASFGKRFYSAAKLVGKLTISQRIAAIVLTTAVAATSVASIVHHSNASSEDVNAANIDAPTVSIVTIPTADGSGSDDPNGENPDFAAETTIASESTEPTSTQPAQTQTAPTTPTPATPAPTQPTPTQPAPTQPTPTQPPPTEPTPTETTPTEPTPTETMPTETTIPTEVTLTITTSSFTMYEGENFPVEYTYTGLNTLSWQSSNPQVATVTDGMVTALSFGTTVISVTDNTSVSEITITIYDPNDLFLPPDYQYFNGYKWNGDQVVTADGNPVTSMLDMYGWYYLDPDNEFGCYNQVYVDLDRNNAIIAVYLPSWQIRVPDPNEDTYSYINGYEWDYANGCIVDSEGNPVSGLHEEDGEFYEHDTSDIYKYTHALLGGNGTVVALDKSSQSPNSPPDPSS